MTLALSDSKNLEHHQLPSSRKFLACWLFPRERCVGGWEVSQDPIFTRVSKHWVNRVLEGKVELVRKDSLPIVEGEFYFNELTKELSVYPSEDPRSTFLTLEYKLFFSNAPLSLPHDLDSGREVLYEAVLDDASKWKEFVDNDTAVGKLQAGSGTVKFINTDGFWDDVFEKLWWDSIEIECYNLGNDLANKRVLTRGILSDKKFNKESVSFTVKSFVEKLRSDIQLGNYSLSDGNIPLSLVGRTKRRIYGYVEGLKPDSLDQIQEGIELTGTFSGVAGNLTIDVSGSTELLEELSPEDYISYTIDDEDYELIVEDLTDSQITVTEEIEKSFNGLVLTARINKPWQKLNRPHLVANHELKEFKCLITHPISFNRFLVDDPTDFEADDIIFVNGEKTKIRLISGNEIVLKTNLNQVPSVANEVVKLPVQEVYIRSLKAIYERDYTVLNTNGEARLVFNEDAELNLARATQLTGTSLTFTNNSRSVTGIDTKFTEEIKTRDWIKGKNEAEYYEVLKVIDDTNLTLRKLYAQATVSDYALIKKPEVIADDTLITVSCFGKTFDNLSTGKFIKTGADVNLDLMLEAGVSESSIDLEGFESMNLEADYLVSMMLPESPHENKPQIMKVMDMINASIFASIHYNKDYQLTMTTVSSDRPTDILRIDDSDITGTPLVESTGREVLQKVIVNYRFFDADRSTGESGSKDYEVVNEHVFNISSVEREKTYKLYLYSREDAEMIARKLSFLRESPNITIKVSAKQIFNKSIIGDVVQCDFKKNFNRFGSNSNLFIGKITYLERDESDTTAKISDLSGWFSKVAVIANDEALDYDQASDHERSITGYITDEYELINNLQETHRTNLIG
ncbi:MAG: hypothetical protein ACPGJV_02530 [Bacteriovoracaceae bacterium]